LNLLLALFPSHGRGRRFNSYSAHQSKSVALSTQNECPGKNRSAHPAREHPVSPRVTSDRAGSSKLRPFFRFARNSTQSGFAGNVRMLIVAAHQTSWPRPVGRGFFRRQSLGHFTDKLAVAGSADTTGWPRARTRSQLRRKRSSQPLVLAAIYCRPFFSASICSRSA
jgi:hypothetical protein